MDRVDDGAQMCVGGQIIDVVEISSSATPLRAAHRA
jgi:hypothetical protein